MNGIKICGTGLALPSRILTNEDLTHMVDTTDEWIVSRTGIRTRHILAPGESLAAITAQAARQALQNGGISPDQIGACIVASCTAENAVPSAACCLQRDLGLPRDIPCFDLNAACTGFVFALHTMECLLQGSSRKYGLVIGAENFSRVMDWSDRSTCILFGDGAGAALVESRPEYSSVHAVLGSSGNEEILRLSGVSFSANSSFSMEGQKVFKFAVKAIPYCMDEVLKKAGCRPEDVDYFVFHQANARIIDLVAKKHHIPQEKYYSNIEHYGNTSAASIPICLAELAQQGKLPSGSKALLVGFGGGLTWGGALVEFA